jgi:succinyl-CoA synthetase alpha subunit
LEAIDAEVPLIVCITEGIPVLDMVRVKAGAGRLAVAAHRPNCPGVITPDACKIGICRATSTAAAPVGFVVALGTLTYEAVAQTTAAAARPVHCVGIGGDPVKGKDFVDGSWSCSGRPDERSPSS